MAHQREMAAFFASLTPEQWDVLLGGDRLPLERFSPGQRQQILEGLQILCYGNLENPKLYAVGCADR